MPAYKDLYCHGNMSLMEVSPPVCLVHKRNPGQQLSLVVRLCPLTRGQKSISHSLLVSVSLRCLWVKQSLQTLGVLLVKGFTAVDKQNFCEGFSCFTMTGYNFNIHFPVLTSLFSWQLGYLCPHLIYPPSSIPLWSTLSLNHYLLEVNVSNSCSFSLSHMTTRMQTHSSWILCFTLRNVCAAAVWSLVKEDMTNGPGI